jgi:hypothetical protein
MYSEEEMIEINKGYLFFKYVNSGNTDFHVFQNGKYFLRYFKYSNEYLHTGKTLKFEINITDIEEKDMDEHINKVKRRKSKF